MKKHIIILLVCSLLVVLISGTQSCKKLDEHPVSFVAPDNFFKTIPQVESAFAGSMNKLWSYWGGYGYGYGAFISDDQFIDGDLDLSASNGDDLWQAHYAAILTINSAIKAVKAGSVTGASQADIDLLIGQAEFLRAYNYFMLVRMFGGLPLITDESPDPMTNKMSRSPIADVYAQIESDFKDAILKLPDTWDGAPGKPNRDAARGLLAKVYLTMATAPLNDVSNYQKAADQALLVMQNPNHTHYLVDSVNQVFSLDNKYGPEIMWSFASTYDDIATDPQIWAPSIYAENGGWGDAGIDPTFEQSYPDQPRKTAYMLTDYRGVHYTDFDEARPFCKKYIYITDADFESYASTSNIPIIRYADVLLIFAEATNMANGGPTQPAVDALNQVIDRANGYVPNVGHPLATTGMTKAAFDAAVIQERSWELFFEYDRWFDLIRKKMLEQVNPLWAANFDPAGHYYLFAIPATDLTLNKNLEQNPGYPTPLR